MTPDKEIALVTAEDDVPGGGLINRATTRYGQLSELIVLGRTVYNIGKRAQAFYTEKTSYEISVASPNALYDALQDWLVEQIQPADRRSLKASIRTVYNDDPFADYALSGDDMGVHVLSLKFNEERTRTVVIDGHKVKIRFQGGTRPDAGRIREIGSSGNHQPDVLILTAASEAGSNAVAAFLDRLVKERAERKRKSTLMVLNSFGSWQRRDDLPSRPTASVILREGLMDGLVADLGKFLDDEAAYTRRGIPWHRGYLLHGPPGTGKTSIAKALANEFNLDLWYIPLGDLTKDASLLSLLGQLKPRSMLLLEDVDVFSAAASRDPDRHGVHAESGAENVSLSGLLNALDGVATPHGLITFLTTNDLSAIDDALLRPGRVDRLEKIDYPTEEQVVRLFNFFYQMDSTKHLLSEIDLRHLVTRSPAELLEAMKQNMDSPARARQMLLTGK